MWYLAQWHLPCLGIRKAELESVYEGLTGRAPALREQSPGSVALLRASNRAGELSDNPHTVCVHSEFATIWPNLPVIVL